MMRRRLRIAQWVLVPAVVFGLTEGLARMLPRGTWYDRPIRELGQAGVTEDAWDIVVVGNSRVMQTVDAALLATELREFGVAVHRAYSLARGYTTAREHAIGLERIIAARGGGERLMVISATSGGEMDAVAAWADPGAPQYLTQVMRASDLPAYWRSRWDALDDKLGNTFDYLAGKVSVAMDRRHGVRGVLSSRVWPYLAAKLSPADGGAAASMLSDAAETAQWKALDPARLRLAIEQLRAEPRVPLTAAHPLNRWIDLVEGSGGVLVFYPAPITRAEAAYRAADPARSRGAAAQRARMAEAGVWWVEPEFAYTDADLLDAIHMDDERRPEFTAALAKVIAERAGGTRATRSVISGEKPAKVE